MSVSRRRWHATFNRCFSLTCARKVITVEIGVIFVCLPRLKTYREVRNSRVLNLRFMEISGIREKQHQLQHHDYWHIKIILLLIIVTIKIVLDTWLSPRSSMRALILPLVSLPRVRVPGSLIRLGGDYQLINDDDNHCHNSYHWERFIITGVFDISKRAGFK